MYQCTVADFEIVSAHSSRFLYQRTAADFYISAQQPIFLKRENKRMGEEGKNKSRGNEEREGRKKIGGIRNQMCMRVKRKREERKERKERK